MRVATVFGRLLPVTILGVIAACATSDAPAGPAGGSTPEPVSYPEFTVTSPERAAVLEQGGIAVQNVAVTGKACDARYPIASLTLNGTMVPVSGTDLCQNFNVNVPSRWGLTIVTGEVRNNRGTTRSLARAFLRSGAFLPPAHTKTPAAKIPYGIVTNVQGAALDDHDRLTSDDLGTLLSLAATQTNWNTAVPNPIAASPDGNHDGNIDTYTYDCPIAGAKTNRLTGYRITRATPAHGPVAITVVPDPNTSNGVKITLTASNISIPVTVVGVLDLGCVGNPEATVTGTVRAATITVTFTEVVANDTARYQDFGMASTGVDVDVDFSGLAIIDNLVNAISSALASAVTNPNFIGQFIIAQMEPQMNGLVQDFIPNDLATAAAGIALANDDEPSAVPTGHDGLLFGKSVQATASSAKPGAPPAKGPPQKGGEPPKFGGPNKKPVNFGIKDDLVNQFFWVAWRKGVFDFPSLSALGCDGSVTGGTVSFSTVALLPPVLMSGTADTVQIGIGDVQLTGTIARSVVGGTGAPLDVTLYASAIASATFGITSARTLTFAFAPNPQVAAELVAISDSTVLEQARVAIAPFFACVAQKIAQVTIGQFPVLGLKLPGIVPGKQWIAATPKVGREGDYTTIKGDVELSNTQ